MSKPVVCGAFAGGERNRSGPPRDASDLLLDCFKLAVELRDLDMRASPYDLTEWGREPVRIETPGGRRIYEDEQKCLAATATPLRERLIAVLSVHPAPEPGASRFLSRPRQESENNAGESRIASPPDAHL